MPEWGVKAMFLMKTALWRFVQGFAAGGIATLLVLYLMSVYGLPGRDTVAVSGALLLHWCRENLGFSVIAFGLCAILFCMYLARLAAVLRQERPLLNRVESLEAKLDLIINLFFGIGVIWTAIGMRNALLVSLSGLDAASAARLGAFAILQRLIEGGMLVALSTTIVGGLGGYLLRLIKMWAVGAGLAQVYAHQEHQAAHAITERLDTITVLLSKRREAGAGSLS